MQGTTIQNTTVYHLPPSSAESKMILSLPPRHLYVFTVKCYMLRALNVCLFVCFRRQSSQLSGGGSTPSPGPPSATVSGRFEWCVI